MNIRQNFTSNYIYVVHGVFISLKILHCETIQKCTTLQSHFFYESLNALTFRLRISCGGKKKCSCFHKNYSWTESEWKWPPYHEKKKTFCIKLWWLHSSQNFMWRKNFFDDDWNAHHKLFMSEIRSTYEEYLLVRQWLMMFFLSGFVGSAGRLCGCSFHPRWSGCGGWES